MPSFIVQTLETFPSAKRIILDVDPIVGCQEVFLCTAWDEKPHGREAMFMLCQGGILLAVSRRSHISKG